MILAFMKTFLICYITLNLSTRVKSKIIRIPPHVTANFVIVDSNFRLPSNYIANITVTNVQGCVAGCIHNNDCITFNFNKVEKSCELLSISKFDGVGLLRWSPNWIHYETDDDARLVGPICQATSPCNPRQVCEDTYTEGTGYYCKCRDGFHGDRCQTYQGIGSTHTNPAPSCALLMKRYKDLQTGSFHIRRNGKVTRKCCKRPAPRLRWPLGTYGILSQDACPPDWEEFTQCWKGEAETTTNFSMNVGQCVNQLPGSIKIRFCIKGPNVPSGSGGFGSDLFVLKKSVLKNRYPCNDFGSYAGHAFLDLKGRDDNNINLHFCFIKKCIPSASAPIEIGQFNQKFAIFANPDNSSCPTLASPNGKLNGKKEVIFIDMENSGPTSFVEYQTPFEIVGNEKDAKLGMCVYEPSN